MTIYSARWWWCSSSAAVLLVLLAAEGVTILRVHQLLSPHVFIGVVLIPPVLPAATGLKRLAIAEGSDGQLYVT